MCDIYIINIYISHIYILIIYICVIYILLIYISHIYINNCYTGTWGIARLRDSVKSSCYSRVTSNFISVYAYGARSRVSFLTVLGDERS